MYHDKPSSSQNNDNSALAAAKKETAQAALAVKQQEGAVHKAEKAYEDKVTGASLPILIAETRSCRHRCPDGAHAA